MPMREGDDPGPGRLAIGSMSRSTSAVARAPQVASSLDSLTGPVLSSLPRAAAYNEDDHQSFRSLARASTICQGTPTAV